MREIPLLGIPVPEISLDMALLAGRALFLVFCFVLAAVAFTRWRRAADRSTNSLAEQTRSLLERLAGVEQQLAAANTRLVELNKLTDLAERLEGELHRTSSGTAAPPSYQIAIRLARGGSSIDELIQSCGISRQEAELVQRLHAPPRRPALRPVATA